EGRSSTSRRRPGRFGWGKPSRQEARGSGGISPALVSRVLGGTASTSLHNARSVPNLGQSQLTNDDLQQFLACFIPESTNWISSDRPVSCNFVSLFCKNYSVRIAGRGPSCFTEWS